MTAATETWEVGSTGFIIEVTKHEGNFVASCCEIPGIVATGPTIENALNQFAENADDFFTDFVASLPLKERRKICLWMQGPEHPEYVPKSTANKRPEARKGSGSPPHRATEKTSAPVGHFSPASLPYGEQSHVRRCTASHGIRLDGYPACPLTRCARGGETEANHEDS